MICPTCCGEMRKEGPTSWKCERGHTVEQLTIFDYDRATVGFGHMPGKVVVHYEERESKETGEKRSNRGREH